MEWKKWLWFSCDPGTLRNKTHKIRTTSQGRCDKITNNRRKSSSKFIIESVHFVLKLTISFIWVVYSVGLESMTLHLLHRSSLCPSVCSAVGSLQPSSSDKAVGRQAPSSFHHSQIMLRVVVLAFGLCVLYHRCPEAKFMNVQFHWGFRA